MELQAFMISGLMMDNSFMCQKLFNHHVAMRMVAPWRNHIQNSFQFYSARDSIPKLIDVIDGIEGGKYGLKKLMEVTSSALNYPLDVFIERLL